MCVAHVAMPANAPRTRRVSGVSRVAVLACMLWCVAGIASVSKSAQPTSAVTCALCKEAFKLIDEVVEGNKTYDFGLGWGWCIGRCSARGRGFEAYGEIN